MRFRPSKEQHLQQVEHTCQVLREQILSGRFPEGSYLPPEKQLMNMFGLSNYSLRTALARLEEEGWIIKQARIGNRVAGGRRPVRLRLQCSTHSARNLHLSELLDRFNRQYPWISAEWVDVQWSYAYDRSPAPDCDLIIMENSHFGKIREAGGLDALEPTACRKETLTRARSAFAVNGVAYAQPLLFSPIVLAYNRAHFREAGLPEPNGDWHWSDLIENAVALSDGKGRYGFCFHTLSLNRWPLWLLQSGERFEWDAAGRLHSLKGSNMLEAIRLCKELLHHPLAFPLYRSESSADVDQMFMDGKISMTLTSYMAMNAWTHEGVEFDVSPVPFISEPRTLLISLGIGVNRASRRKEEGRLLIEFLTSPEAQDTIRRETLSIPAVDYPEQEAWAETAQYRPRRYSLYREMLFSCRSHDDLNLSYSQYPLLIQHLKAYWAGMISDEELCARLEEQLRA